MVATETTPTAKTTFETVIGLEVHCQLQTESKIFAADVNAFGADPNTNISVITLAHPGVLPKLNRRAVDFAVTMGLACGCDITRRNVFARKNYFYPDLPKGYQLSQDKDPICVGGTIAVTVKNRPTGPRNLSISATDDTYQTTIYLHHIHLEEDAGKSVHDASPFATCLDYNRAGTPLIEMVTEPCLRSAEEAGQFLIEVRRLVRYLGICDGNMEEGSLRCDVNVSIRPAGETKLGTKVEVKNLNSIRNVQRAVEAEYNRQIAMTEAGETIKQETRTFDAATGQTVGMREKETMNDYRYFPDPDLQPVVISDAWLAEIRATLPALPAELYRKFTTHYGLTDYDAAQLTDSRETAVFFEAVCEQTNNYKAVANWIMGPVRGRMSDDGSFPVTAAKLAELITLIDAGTISQTAAQTVFGLLIQQPGTTAIALATANGLLQNRNTDTLQALVSEVLAANPDKVKQYRNGKKGLLGLFVGDVMKKTKGAADPKLVNELITKELAL